MADDDKIGGWWIVLAIVLALYNFSKGNNTLGVVFIVLVLGVLLNGRRELLHFDSKKDTVTSRVRRPRRDKRA